VVAAATLSLGAMTTLEYLTAIQGHVIECRRLAAATPDIALAYRLYFLADQIEERAREVDLALCLPD
jgi:hypothetical protein